MYGMCLLWFLWLKLCFEGTVWNERLGRDGWRWFMSSFSNLFKYQNSTLQRSCGLLLQPLQPGDKLFWVSQLGWPFFERLRRMCLRLSLSIPQAWLFLSLAGHLCCFVFRSSCSLLHSNVFWLLCNLRPLCFWDLRTEVALLSEWPIYVRKRQEMGRREAMNQLTQNNAEWPWTLRIYFPQYRKIMETWSWSNKNDKRVFVIKQ